MRIEANNKQDEKCAEVWNKLFENNYVEFTPMFPDKPYWSIWDSLKDPQVWLDKIMKQIELTESI